MTIDDMKIYIVTSDKYNHLLQIHSYLFNKFWGTDREVIVLGYKEPDFKLPSNFKFFNFVNLLKIPGSMVVI